MKLKVKDLDEVDIKRGFVICNNEDFCCLKNLKLLLFFRNKL